MSDLLIKTEISEIVSRLRWLESRDTAIDYETRYWAMRKALGLLNRATNQSRFTNTRRALFAIMNEARLKKEFSFLYV